MEPEVLEVLENQGGMLPSPYGRNCHRIALYRMNEGFVQGVLQRKLICKVAPNSGMDFEVALSQYRHTYSSVHCGLLISEVDDRLGCTAFPLTGWQIEDGVEVSIWATAKHGGQPIFADGMDPRLVVAADVRRPEQNGSFSAMLELLEEPFNLSPGSTLLYDAHDEDKYLASSGEPDLMFFKAQRHNLPDHGFPYTPVGTQPEDIKNRLVCVAGFPAKISDVEGRATLATDADYKAALAKLARKLLREPDPHGRTAPEIKSREAFVLDIETARNRVFLMNGEVYFPYELNIGPGRVEAANNSTLCGCWSSVSQMFGGPVVHLEDPHLLEGVHLRRGSHWSDLHNIAMSVNHGAFVIGYAQHVLPMLTQAPQDAFAAGHLQHLHAYLHLHQHRLRTRDLWDEAELFMKRHPTDGNVPT